MYKMLHYSRPWECLVDSGSKKVVFIFIINGAERTSGGEKKITEASSHEWVMQSKHPSASQSCLLQKAFDSYPVSTSEV